VYAVNETEEVEAGKINLNRPFIILEKLDGSMVCPFYTEGKLRFATKNGVTDTSKLVESYVARSDIPYLEYSARWVDKGYRLLQLLRRSPLCALASCVSCVSFVSCESCPLIVVRQIFAHLRVVQPEESGGARLPRGIAVLKFNFLFMNEC
jgi:hypothetical protein